MGKPTYYNQKDRDQFPEGWFGRAGAEMNARAKDGSLTLMGIHKKQADALEAQAARSTMPEGKTPGAPPTEPHTMPPGRTLLSRPTGQPTTASTIPKIQVNPAVSPATTSAAPVPAVQATPGASTTPLYLGQPRRTLLSMEPLEDVPGRGVQEQEAQTPESVEQKKPVHEMASISGATDMYIGKDNELAGSKGERNEESSADVPDSETLRMKQETALDLIAKGEPVESVEHEWGVGGQGATIPPYDPIDLTVDLLTGGLAGAGRKGVLAIVDGLAGKGKGLVREGAKLLGRNVAEDVGYGAVAGGLLTAAEMNGAGATIEALAGTVGPMATSGVLTLSRKGLATWMKQTARGNPEVYEGLVRAARETPGNKLSEVIFDVDREVRQMGQAYDKALRDPLGGPADEVLAELNPDNLQRILVERGPAMEKDGEIVVRGRELKKETGSGRGYGLVKIIWRHGENSTKNTDEQVQKNDVINFPKVLREYLPAEVTHGRRRWSVSRKDGRQINYVVSSIDEGNAEKTVSIYITNEKSLKNYSKHK